MRILLSNHQLTSRSGSELATCELARGLAARGHHVAVFTFFKGALAEELSSQYGIPVYDDMQADQIILFGAEIVHTHHAPCAHFLRLYTMGAVRIHSMLGALTPLESPPLDASIVSLGFAISEEVRGRTLETPFGDTVPLQILRNWYDDPKAATLPVTPWQDMPRIAVISNHFAPAIADALTALQSAGELHAEYFGIESSSTDIDSALIDRYDVIISIGRTAILAAACGKPCIMADIHGSDGLLTIENLEQVQRFNFSGRATATPITADHFRQELVRAQKIDQAQLREQILKNFSIATRISFLEDQYAALLAANASGSRGLDRGDWPAEGLAYAELAARTRHAEHLLALEQASANARTASFAAELETLARMLADQDSAHDEVRQKLADAEIALQSLTTGPQSDPTVVDHLQHTMASRDEAIAWLQTELAFAKRTQQTGRPAPVGVRTKVRNALAQVAKRAPAVRFLVRSAIPLPVRERLHRVLAGRPPMSVPLTSPAASVGLPGTDIETPKLYDILCFANIEWAARYQRPQQLMSQFARAGHRVFYIVASRRPPHGASYALEQVADNIYQVALSSEQAPDHYAHALTPTTLHSYCAAIDALANDMGIRSAVQIVHLPFWGPLTRTLRERRDWKINYDCMDEWDSFPRIGAALLEEERHLVTDCDLLTVTGRLLEEKWRSVAKNALLIRNGVDNVFFSERLVPNELLNDVPRPIIGYYGALAEWVDFELIAALATACPDWRFVLIGDHFTPEVERLKGHANVHLLGLQPYADMPRYLYHFDACIIPFKLNKITHAVDPVKFYEFLAGGKPIIATPLEELRPFVDYATFATTAAEFKSAIAAHLVEAPDQAAEKRKDFARANDWGQRFESYSAALAAVHPMVSIIVVTYGNLELTRLCIDSLVHRTQYPRYEIIVVDNASTDGTPDYLRSAAAQHDNVRIILNDTNRGFAAANNQGLAIASGDTLVLLNNDTVVPSGWLEGLLHHLKDASIGLIGPVTNAVGNEAKVEPGYSDLSGLQRFADARRRQFADKAFDIRMLAMFCVAMRRTVFDQIGPLDENFGVGMFEDDDYSMRIKAAGLRVVCAEEVYIHHFGQAAFKTLIETGEYDPLWQRNHAYFESKWGTWKPHTHRAVDPRSSLPASDPAIAVIVMAHGLRPTLAAAVRSVIDQGANVEVVVVHSGEGDPEIYLRDAGLDVKVIRSHVRLLPGAARNVGIQATDAPIVAFLADDCIAQPGWIAERLAAHKSGASSVSSALLSHRADNPVALAAHLSLYVCRLPKTHPDSALKYGASYNRALFERHGLFREDMEGGEDTEFHDRLRDADRPIWRPEVRTVHTGVETIGDLLKTQYQRGQRMAAVSYLLGRHSRGAIAKDAVRRTSRIIRESLSFTERSERLTVLLAIPFIAIGNLAYAWGAWTSKAPK